MSANTVFARDVPLFIESESGHIGKFPRNVWARWGVRVILAAPFVVLALWYNSASGGDWAFTANDALASRVDTLDWGSGDVAVIGQLYPPITSLLAIVIPGGALGLGIAGSLVAGFMLQRVIESMQRKDFPFSVRLVFLLTLAVTPIFGYIVTTNFEGILGLTFFGLGMLDLVRFVTYANTQAGFRAGILFACSAFSDSTGLLAAIVAALAGMFIIRSRTGSTFANAIVVVFPTIALTGSLMLLGIAFRVGPLAMIRGDLSWNSELVAAFLTYLATPAGWVYLAPTAIVVITSFALRYPGVALVAVLLTAMTLLAYFLGLTPPGTAGNNYILMLLLAVAIVPTPKSFSHAGIVSLTAVLLWIVGWVGSYQRQVVVDWIAVLNGGVL